MADVFIDCEWIGGDYLTILGAYSPGQDRFQLYDKRLTRNRFSRFLNLCRNRGNSRYTLLFCHGPDVGKIQNVFGLELKDYFYCVNTLTAFRNFTTFQDVSLGHLERYFGISRRYVLSSDEMKKLWNSHWLRDRKIVLDYNWEDCVNLWHLVNILKSEYGVTRHDFKQISMNP